MATKKKAAPKKKASTGKGNKNAPAAGGGDTAYVNPDEEKDHTDKTQKERPTTDELAEQLANQKAQKAAGTVTYRKIKLDKKGFLAVDISTIEADHSTTKDSKSLSRPVHPDLRKALAAFAIHYGILNDYISTRSVKDPKKFPPELVKSYHISGISIGGADGEEGIMITGHKNTRRKKALILNTPFERFEEVAETRYIYMDDLLEKVDYLTKEVALYLSGEKVGEDNQLELGFNESEKGADIVDPDEEE